MPAQNTPDPLKYNVEELLKDLYEKEYSTMLQWILRMYATISREDAEDIVQNTFEKVCKRAGKLSLRNMEETKKYIHRSFINACMDLAEKKSKDRKFRKEYAFLFTNEQDADPALLLLMQEARKKALELLKELPPATQQLLHERFVEKKPYEQIAAELGRSANGVKQQVFRGLEQLRKKAKELLKIFF